MSFDVLRFEVSAPTEFLTLDGGRCIRGRLFGLPITLNPRPDRAGPAGSAMVWSMLAGIAPGNSNDAIEIAELVEHAAPSGRRYLRADLDGVRITFVEEPEREPADGGVMRFSTWVSPAPGKARNIRHPAPQGAPGELRKLSAKVPSKATRHEAAIVAMLDRMGRIPEGGDEIGNLFPVDAASEEPDQDPGRSASASARPFPYRALATRPVLRTVSSQKSRRAFGKPLAPPSPILGLKLPDEAPPARNKKNWRSGLRPWLFAEIVKRSPVLRSDLIAEARALGIIKSDDRGPNSVRIALLRLDAQGLIAFDRKHVWWSGRSIPLRSIGQREWCRLYRLAQGDRAKFDRMRLAELARLQAEKDAALWALRPADAAGFQPPPVGPQRRRRWKIESNDRVRAILIQLRNGPIRRALDRALASQPPLSSEDLRC